MESIAFVRGIKIGHNPEFWYEYNQKCPVPSFPGTSSYILKRNFFVSTSTFAGILVDRFLGYYVSFSDCCSSSVADSDIKIRAACAKEANMRVSILFLNFLLLKNLVCLSYSLICYSNLWSWIIFLDRQNVIIINIDNLLMLLKK